MKRLVSLMMVMVMLLSFGSGTFAALDVDIEDINSINIVRDFYKLDIKQIDKFIDSTFDYASIVQFLDTEDLFRFAVRIKNEVPEKTEDEIEGILKLEILKRGFNSGALELDKMGNVILSRGGEVQPYSYGDLPYIQNRLGESEKKVFNESLFKGLGVLSAAQFAMNYYQRYYNSSYNYADDNADAFRHGVWMAYSAFNSGADYARRFGIAHEDDWYDTALSRSMDLYNNNQGIEISYGIYGNTPPDLVGDIVLYLVDEGVKNGDLRRFKGTDIGIRTSLVGTNSTGARK